MMRVYQNCGWIRTEHMGTEKMMDLYEAQFAKPIAASEAMPEWAVKIATVQVIVVILVSILIVICMDRVDTHATEERLEAVVQRLEMVEPAEEPLLEITHEFPPPGARGKAGRTVSHLRIHRNPYARAD